MDLRAGRSILEIKLFLVGNGGPNPVPAPVFGAHRFASALAFLFDRGLVHAQTVSQKVCGRKRKLLALFEKPAHG